MLKNDMIPPWGPGRGPLPFQLGLCMFSVLSLELALIRWAGGQIRVIAYFSNMVLITSFLGTGLGIALGRTRPNLVHWLLPALALLSAVLCFSGELHLMRMTFPDPTISMWGGESEFEVLRFVTATLAIACCFAMITTVFMLAGIPAGWLFGQIPPLTAYSADLIGSLIGVLAASAVAAFECGPGVWLLLGVTPFIWISRKPLSVVAGVAVVSLGIISSGNALFSPYNRIDVDRDLDHSQNWDISVNRDFHQQVLDLSDSHLSREPNDGKIHYARLVYDLPFVVKGTGQALVVGAGTGNDVAAALRHDFTRVVSVDIDSRLLALGNKLHPEKPYDDSRVQPVINDARAYFAANPERFDVVCYGLLDSHAMFSAMSTLRLDNYVYTLEGLKQGWAHVKDDGLLSVSFSMYAGDWMATRFYSMIKEATGLDPVVVSHGYNFGVTFLVSRNIDMSRIHPALFFSTINVTKPGVRIPTDDWPYLYLKPGIFPVAYVAILGLLLLGTIAAVQKVYGRELFHSGTFDIPLFFMGAAFMLLETRLVTSLSLLFGSTWVVNSSVFSGVLLMILLANLFVNRFPPRRLAPWYAMLGASLLITTLMSPALISSLPFLSRMVMAGLIYSLPIGFAGVIFSTKFRYAKNPAYALGANLIGAVIGGCLEYVSIYLGLQAMGWLALTLYALSYLTTPNRKRLCDNANSRC